MSFIPGKSFDELMQEGYHFTQKQIVYWAMQLCSAMNYLHSHNPPIIHGDIKPANIMLTPEGNICLIDFNISFFLNENAVLGYSEGYTSPEQYMYISDRKRGSNLSGHSRINEKSDIYSLGATLYYLATGEKPGNYKKTPDMTLLEEKTSEAFAEVIRKAMKLEPDKRFKNAFEMFQAFQSMGKKERRYKNLLLKQRILWGIQLTALSGFIVLGGYGVYNIKKANVERYNELVEEQTDYRKKADYEKEKNIYEEAVKIFPEGLESYYQNALALYEQQQYEECITFIDYDVLKNEKIDLRDKRVADIYYLKAESHYELHEYQKAVEIFRKVLEYGEHNSTYYRDYALALVYNNQVIRAETVLEEAIEYGLEEDSIYYVKGEIEKFAHKYSEAENEFYKCIECTKDVKLKMRSYILLSEMYREENLRKKELTLLREAKSVLPPENQMIILERLAQVNIDLAAGTESQKYLEEASEILDEVITQGWDTWQTYDNLVVLNQRQGQLDTAEQWLKVMEQKYGEIYQIYKRYAFLEIEKQEQEINENRNYALFVEYYEKAVKGYRGQLKDNNTDAEMELLDNVYQQVKEGGWLQ